MAAMTAIMAAITATAKSFFNADVSSQSVDERLDIFGPIKTCVFINYVYNTASWISSHLYTLWSS